jgi:thioredoxin-like negative regulator of GroEL
LSHSLADNNDDERLRLASKFARTLLSNRRYEEAEELFVEVIETTKRVLSDEHPHTLISIANLVATYRN